MKTSSHDIKKVGQKRQAKLVFSSHFSLRPVLCSTWEGVGLVAVEVDWEGEASGAEDLKQTNKLMFRK